MPGPDHEIAVLLPGGGARAAYQVGVLRAVAHILGRDQPHPFRIICGTSAGAINAATLAVHADSFRRGVSRLVRWWSRVDVKHVYRANLANVSLHGVRWLASVLIGVGGPKGSPPSSILPASSSTFGTTHCVPSRSMRPATPRARR